MSFNSIILIIILLEACYIFYLQLQVLALHNHQDQHLEHLSKGVYISLTGVEQLAEMTGHDLEALQSRVHHQIQADRQELADLMK